MKIASYDVVVKTTTLQPHHYAHEINKALVKLSNNRMPCYATYSRRNGEKNSLKWVSASSLLPISRLTAAKLLDRVGVNIDDLDSP